MVEQSLVATRPELSAASRCPACRSVVRAESVICLGCGGALRATRVQHNLPWIVPIAVIVIMAVVVGAALGLSLRG